MIRLAKFIAQCGVCSRRQAEILIRENRIKVKGQVINTCAYNVNIDDDIVHFDEKPIHFIKKTQLWCFYKPRGLITTHKDPQNRPTVFNYIHTKFKLPRIVSVGRLDLNSEGLLLLTNDSNFSSMAESPDSKWPRVYKVRVFGNINPQSFQQLQQGYTIDNIFYKPIKVEIEKTSIKSSNHWLFVTLHEGKNREIRKIMESFNLQVNRLIRISYGPFHLKDLKTGEIREEQYNPKKFYPSKKNIQVCE